jgi:cytochrome c oxidase subunit 1
MNDTLGKIHFWGTIIGMNGVFFPMFIQGMAGVLRRWYDGGMTYQYTQHVIQWNEFMSISAFLLGIAQIPFFINLFRSIKNGEKVSDNYWEATTLEWSATTSPPLAHGNFETIPTVHHGPYEYSVPNQTKDFTSQNEPEMETMKIPSK